MLHVRTQSVAYQATLSPVRSPRRAEKGRLEASLACAHRTTRCSERRGPPRRQSFQARVFPAATSSLIFRCRRESPSNVAGIFIQITRNLAGDLTQREITPVIPPKA